MQTFVLASGVRASSSNKTTSTDMDVKCDCFRTVCSGSSVILAEVLQFIHDRWVCVCDLYM